MRIGVVGMDKVRDIEVSEIKGFSDLLNAYIDSGGFMARYVGLAYRIWKEMLTRRDEITIFMSFPAAIVSTGLRGILKEIFRRRWIDIAITTCGTLDHDIARSYRDYYKGEFNMDDRELRDREIHRLGNILIPFDNYGGIIEKTMREILNGIYDSGNRSVSSYELAWEIGRHLDNDDSILTWAYRNRVKVIIPGIYDGAVGYQIWVFQQFHRDFQIDLYKDEKTLSDTVYESSKTGAIVLGGGISKHHLIWWNQFRGGLDYAIQITTAVEYDGSLSGARLSEAISWNKVGKDSPHVSIWGDVTIILPIIVSALIEDGY